MRLEYDENQNPVFITKESGVIVTLAFSENPRSENLRQTVLDLLTASYESRISASS